MQLSGFRLFVVHALSVLDPGVLPIQEDPRSSAHIVGCPHSWLPTFVDLDTLLILPARSIKIPADAASTLEKFSAARAQLIT